MILVGDVGGTQTRLALAANAGGRWQLSRLAVVPTRREIDALVGDYCRAAGAPSIDAFGCCGAGPVLDDGRIRLTNTEVCLDPRDLGRAAGTPHVALVNDFAAVAHAIPLLDPSEQTLIAGGEPDPRRPKLVMGAGTGLGVALLVKAADWLALPGEGGHAELAAHDDAEVEALRRLRHSHGRVSAETVLSGPGLERLHAALARGRALRAAEVAEAAWRGDAAAQRTVRTWVRWLAHYAADLALITGAAGGVYIAGGIIPGWGPRFDAAAFRNAFEEHPRYGAWLRGVPILVVTHPQPGLLGLAGLAQRAS